MRDWILVESGSGSGADLIVCRLVSLGLVLRVERWRGLVVESSFSSMTILTRMRLCITSIEYHALDCQHGPLQTGGDSLLEEVELADTVLDQGPWKPDADDQ